MGRITIFSADGCSHCARTKAALTKHGIPYVEISVTQYPKKRNDMLALSNRLSTPQVFFNTRHVGGADDTIKLLNKWAAPDKKGRFKCPYDRYVDEIERQPDPNNPRFAVPDYAPLILKPRPCRDSIATVPLPDGSMASVLQVTETLKSILPIANRAQGVTVYANSFTGAQAVKAIVNHYGVSTEKALEFGMRLQEQQLLHPASHARMRFGNSSGLLLRLQCHHTPYILNSYRVWTEECDPHVVRLLSCLRTRMAHLEGTFTDTAGQMDLVGAARSSTFPSFEEAVCELQKVDLRGMDENTKLAFGINVYNLMVKYAFLKLGVGENALSRTAFFTSVLFDVGGNLFSLQDWENGILRGNQKAPHGLSRPFAKGDPRLPLALSKLDYRIHFGLNCGARSCPPVNDYNPEVVDDELQIVAQSFCEDKDNVKVSVKERHVRLSKIFLWYRADFAPSQTELLSKVVLQHLHGVKRQKLEALLRTNEPIKITYTDYDWTTSAKTYKTFDPKSLKANRRTVRALLHKNPSSRSGFVETAPTSAMVAAS